MRVPTLMVMLVAASMLACGGFGGGSEFAHDLAEHLESEHPYAERTVVAGVGSEVTVGDFSFRFGDPIIVDSEHELPYIRNTDERSAFAPPHTKGLVVPYEIRNNTPVVKDQDVFWDVRTRAGEHLRTGTFNSRMYREEHGLEHDWYNFPPGEWRASAFVWAIQPGQENETVAVIQHEVTKINEDDPRGRRHTVVVDQAIVDLAVPTPGPHINPERR